MVGEDNAVCQAVARAPAAVTSMSPVACSGIGSRFPRGGEREVPGRADPHPQPPAGEAQVPPGRERVLEEHLAGGRSGPHRVSHTSAALRDQHERGRPGGGGVVGPVAPVVAGVVLEPAGAVVRVFPGEAWPARRTTIRARRRIATAAAATSARTTAASHPDDDPRRGGRAAAPSPPAAAASRRRPRPGRGGRSARRRAPAGRGRAARRSRARTRARRQGRAGRRTAPPRARAGTWRGCASRPRSRRCRSRAARARRAASSRRHPFRLGFCLHAPEAATAPAPPPVSRYGASRCRPPRGRCPWISFSRCSAESLKSGLEKPEMYQGEPLSARIMP